MILGRSANLWVAAFAAVFNVICLLNIIVLDTIQIGAVNLAFIALVALVANQSDQTVKALETRNQDTILRLTTANGDKRTETTSTSRRP